MYLVGIDVGTTNTKTVIFDVETGHICAVESCCSIARHPVAEWSEMEGLAFWLRDNMEMLCTLGIAPPQPEITVIGGTTQATPLLQIKAEITGCPIKVPQITEAAATGAALLAGMGANIFHSGEEAASSVVHTVQIYEPDTQAVEIYNTLYEQTYLPARRLLI